MVAATFLAAAGRLVLARRTGLVGWAADVAVPVPGSGADEIGDRGDFVGVAVEWGRGGWVFAGVGDAVEASNCVSNLGSIVVASCGWLGRRNLAFIVRLPWESRQKLGSGDPGWCRRKGARESEAGGRVFNLSLAGKGSW